MENWKEGENCIISDDRFIQNLISLKSYLGKCIVNCTNDDPEIEVEYPHISQVKLHINPNEFVDSKGDSLFENICRDIVNESNFREFLKAPLRHLTNHPSHSKLYSEDPIMGGLTDEVLSFVMNFVKSHHQKALSFIELGCGTGGFLKRIVQTCPSIIDEYVATDFFPIKLDQDLQDKFKIQIKRWNINKPFNLENFKKFDVAVACNSIHTASSVSQTLNYTAEIINEGGFLIIEECITELPLLMWGLDKFIWNTAIDERKYGLWKSKDQWITLFCSLNSKWRPIIWFVNETHLLLLAQKL